MAGTPRFKVYAADGEYIAATKYPEEAAMIIAGRGSREGETIRDGHRKVVWTEGIDGEAAESYDGVSTTVWERSA